MKYRKKPVEIEAVQWTGNNWSDIRELHRGDAFSTTRIGDGPRLLNIATLEGLMIAQPGDWIIKGVKGEVYTCEPDIFEATYEPV